LAVRLAVRLAAVSCPSPVIALTSTIQELWEHMGIATVVVLLLILFVVVALFGVFFTYIYWWLIQRPAPQVAGDMSFSSLDDPVEVLRDKHGVPHIYAESQADLWRTQGFVHAQDRLWQMEQNRRLASGRLAELFGKAALDADRFCRIVGFRRSAEAEWESMQGEERFMLECYVEGINAYIRNRPGRLAAEFNLLRRQPEAWSPVDVLAFGKYVGWSLSVNWESELVRLQLAGQLSAPRAMELEPDYPAGNPVIVEGVGSTEAMRMVQAAGLLLNEYEKIKEWIGGQGASQGSNSWVINAEKSATGHAILANDPHLTLSMPGVWYENHLECRDLKVSGASFPGIPGVMIGHNGTIAWGITNGFADVQDLYLERPHPENPHLFEYNGGWEEATVLSEEIHVRKVREPHVEEVVITRHGPLISRWLETIEVPLALRWAGYEQGAMLRATRRVNQAQNWAEFNAALDDVVTPVLNFTYADSSGNIGYRLAGQIPMRGEGLGLAPSPGWTERFEWMGMIPVNELPRCYNPPSGMIVTANNKIVGDDYPYFLGIEFLPGWRAQRIEEMLRQKKRHGYREMERIQLDTTSLYAARLTPWLAQQESDDPYVKIAINSLRNWGYYMEPDSDAALVFHYTKLILLEMVFGDKLGLLFRRYRGDAYSPLAVNSGFLHRAENRLLELLSTEEESIWYANLKSGRQRSRDELILAALTAAVRRIRREVNPTPRQWAWGRMHQVRYNHPMGSVPILRGYFNRGPFPVGGDTTTPNQTSYAAKLPPGLVQVVASYRLIVDMGNLDSTQSITTSGQSGHPLSPNYADQVPMWLEGIYHPMPWGREAVEKISKHRLWLRPEGIG
jgi:penicillin G amidase